MDGQPGLLQQWAFLQLQAVGMRFSHFIVEAVQPPHPCSLPWLLRFLLTQSMPYLSFESEYY